MTPVDGVRTKRRRNADGFCSADNSLMKMHEPRACCSIPRKFVLQKKLWYRELVCEPQGKWSTSLSQPPRSGKPLPHLMRAFGMTILNWIALGIPGSLCA